MCSNLIGYQNWWSHGNKKTLGQINRGILVSCGNHYCNGTKETRTCNCETNREEKTSSNYDNEGEEKTSSTSEKEEAMNTRHEEIMNACDGYISIYECSKNVSHLT